MSYIYWGRGKKCHMFCMHFFNYYFATTNQPAFLGPVLLYNAISSHDQSSKANIGIPTSII